jgi:hypothetical protein
MPEVWTPPYLPLTPALKIFVTNLAWQSQSHIKPLHQHLALRLVIEGGFPPEEISPRPPVRVEKLRGKEALVFDPSVENEREETILGGLKSKAVDVVVAKPGVGPVVSISVKGSLGAFRNLTNRMEEAIGDATNIHLMYPGLVYCFFHVLKANRASDDGGTNDIAIDASGAPVASIQRYHDVLLGLTGRRLIRDEFSRYEAVSLALIDPLAGPSGHVMLSFPAPESVLRAEGLFPALLQTYDLRFPYTAPSVSGLARRFWSIDSPAFRAVGESAQWLQLCGYEPRVQ